MILVAERRVSGSTPVSGRSVEGMFRRLTPLQLAVDIGIAVACLLVRFTMLLENPAAVVVVVVMATALAMRRLSPGLALGVAWVGAIIQMIALLPPDASNLAILAVLYATARYGSTRVRWAGLASAVVGAFVATAYFFFAPIIALPGGGMEALITGGPGAAARIGLGLVVGFGAGLAVLGLSWTLGLLARTWANARQSRRDKAEAERAVVVEQERNRIARDMHDVVAHSLAVVIAQADGARYAARKDPSSVEDALATISTTAREALGDVRLLLGQLRHSQERGPQPELDDLDALVAQVRASGLDVSLSQVGHPTTLAAGRQLAVYRIAQEALTNALRHGDASRPVVVRLEWGVDAVTLTITNTPGSATSSEPGHGLAGMRERAQLVGGTFATERRDGLFVATARIPVRAEVAA